MSLDDLDEKLFAVELSNSSQVEKQQQPTVSGSSKRRPWHWKHALPNSVDKRDTSNAGKAQSSSSLEGSRRGSVCSSSHSSPIKSSSPKKSKDQQSKKASNEMTNKDDASQKARKDNNVKCDLVDDGRLVANAHLYSVLEEQALGEIIRESVENLFTDGNRSINYRATAALSSNIWYCRFTVTTHVGWRKSHHAILLRQILTITGCLVAWKDLEDLEISGNLFNVPEKSENSRGIFVENEYFSKLLKFSFYITIDRQFVD